MTTQDIGRAGTEEPIIADNGSQGAPDPVRPSNSMLALELMRHWLEEDDEGEQQRTFEALAAGINETRKELGQRLIFPEELRGVTW